MTKWILILSLILAIGCGRVKSNNKVAVEPITVHVDVPEEYTVEQRIGIQAMFQELVNLCVEQYGKNSAKYFECREDAIDAVFKFVEGGSDV